MRNSPRVLSDNIVIITRYDVVYLWSDLVCLHSGGSRNCKFWVGGNHNSQPAPSCLFLVYGNLCHLILVMFSHIIIQHLLLHHLLLNSPKNLNPSLSLVRSSCALPQPYHGYLISNFMLHMYVIDNYLSV